MKVNLVKTAARRLLDGIDVDPNIAARALPGIYYRSCNFCGSRKMLPFEYSSTGLLRGSHRTPARFYGNSTLSHFLSTRFLTLQYLRCRHCNLVFINPLPKFSDVNKASFDGEENVVAWKEADWNNYVTDKLRFICAYHDELRLNRIRQTNRMLDVSCGPGVSLHWLRTERGWSVTGIDPDRHSQKQALNFYDLEIQNGLIDSLDAPEESFDWILMDNSLEHHFDPLGALLHAYRFLRKGGYLCIIVPNADGLSTRHFADNLYWGHWFAYTVQSLGSKLAEIGFQLLGINADQGGRVPEKLLGLGIPLPPEQRQGLAIKVFGPRASDQVARHPCYADYFSLIVRKPEDAGIHSPRERQLLQVAETSLKELSWRDITLENE